MFGVERVKGQLEFSAAQHAYFIWGILRGIWSEKWLELRILDSSVGMRLSVWCVCFFIPTATVDEVQ